MSDALTAVGLLVLSNTCMTTAWYGHLRFKTLSMPMAILAGHSCSLRGLVDVAHDTAATGTQLRRR
jgi:uncharacterized protein (DUF486 family)